MKIVKNSLLILIILIVNFKIAYSFDYQASQSFTKEQCLNSYNSNELEESCCEICFDEMKEEDLISLNCSEKHKFCYNCLVDWDKKATECKQVTTCPNCREVAKIKNINGQDFKAQLANYKVRANIESNLKLKLKNIQLAANKIKQKQIKQEQVKQEKIRQEQANKVNKVSKVKLKSLSPEDNRNNSINLSDQVDIEIDIDKNKKNIEIKPEDSNKNSLVNLFLGSSLGILAYNSYKTKNRKNLSFFSAIFVNQLDKILKVSSKENIKQSLILGSSAIAGFFISKYFTKNSNFK